MDQIEGIAYTIFPKYFRAGNPSFQVIYKSRYNNKINRDQVIKLLAGAVIKLNPLAVVDLTNPKYSIIVEVIKGIVCMGVVQDFYKFKKYNLIEASGASSEDAGKGQKEKEDVEVASSK